MFRFVLLSLSLCLFQDLISLDNNKLKYVLENHMVNDKELIPWDSEKGILRIQNSHSKANFWKLVRFYECQITNTYCSVASSVIALNAMSVPAPASPLLGKYRMWTQENFFSENIHAVIDENDVKERGMSLEELAQVLQNFPIDVFKYEAQDLSHEEIRSSLISALQNPDQCVLALYQRKELLQEGGGHWSPIAAYDEESDSFLILDVAKFKYPPTWVDASMFITSMQTANIYGKSRGFIIINKCP